MPEVDQMAGLEKAAVASEWRINLTAAHETRAARQSSGALFL
jgi:hypothetical protein